MRVTSIEAAKAHLVSLGIVQASVTDTFPGVKPGQLVGIYAKRFAVPPGATIGEWSVEQTPDGRSVLTRPPDRRIVLVRARMVGSARVAATLPVGHHPGRAHAEVTPTVLRIHLADGRSYEMPDQVAFVQRPPGRPLGACLVLWADAQPVTKRCPFCDGTGVRKKDQRPCSLCHGERRLPGPLAIEGGARMFGWWNWVPRRPSDDRRPAWQ